MALPANASPVNSADSIKDTIKTTTGYFTDGDGSLAANAVYTGSLSDSNEKYYFNVNHKNDETDLTSETQFAVTFGHAEGSGSNTYGDSTTVNNTLNGETEAIYRQFAQLLIAEPETSGGFKISAGGSNGIHNTLNARDEYVYILIGKRDKFKERLNKKVWTLKLSGSNTANNAGLNLELTDDSKNGTATQTPAGPRYNIVSGSNGIVHTAAATKTYGWFYPERGVMVFSGAELSASIPGGNSYHIHTAAGITASALTSIGTPTVGIQISGSGTSFNTDFSVGDWIEINSTTQSLRTQITHISGANSMYLADAWTGVSDTGSYSGSAKGSPTSDITASYSYNTTDHYSRTGSDGFAPNLSAGKGTTKNPKNALRLINCMRNASGNALTLRSEEDATQENFFCRIGANEYNFSANPTFVSGSKNKIKNISMHGNPTTFITGIGLWNSAGQLLAISSLSKPLKKNFVSEATIKVKLTY